MPKSINKKDARQVALRIISQAIFKEIGCFTGMSESEIDKYVELNNITEAQRPIVIGQVHDAMWDMLRMTRRKINDDDQQDPV